MLKSADEISIADRSVFGHLQFLRHKSFKLVIVNGNHERVKQSAKLGSRYLRVVVRIDSVKGLAKSLKEKYP